MATRTPGKGHECSHQPSAASATTWSTSSSVPEQGGGIRISDRQADADIPVEAVHPRAPVFILGLHRSGTTWLYERLAASGQFNVLAARHIICFDEYASCGANHERVRARLQQRFADLGLTTRGGEGIRLSPDTLEEYSFILDNHGMGFRLTRRSFPLFLKISRVLRDSDPIPGRLLVKNPWDFANGRLIKELLPEARFIFIHRNPFEVLSSMYRMATALLTKPDPYLTMMHRRYRRFNERPVLRGVVRWFIEHAPRRFVRALIARTERATAGYLRSLSAIPSVDRMDLKYETLCERPDETVATILSHLGVEAHTRDDRPDVVVRAPQVAAEVVAERQLVIRKLSKYASVIGYDLPALSRDL